MNLLYNIKIWDTVGQILQFWSRVGSEKICITTVHKWQKARPLDVIVKPNEK